MAYAILLAVCLVVLGLANTEPMGRFRDGLNFALTPIRSTLTGITRSATSVFTTIAEIEQLRRDRAAAESRVQQLEAELQRIESIRAENERLTELLGIRSSLDYETTVAQVIGRQASPSERIVILDRGTEHGVTVADPVLAGAGALVGSIVEAGPNHSVALLLNDHRSVVIGLVESSRATGEIRGRLSSTLEMVNIPATDTVTVGDRVVTAGLDLGRGIRSPFPRGLLVGRVVDVESTATDIVQSAVVQPAADIDKLEYVLVITDFEPVEVPRPGSSPLPAPTSVPSASPGSTTAP
jgi:rod shape-determining protein MreC